MCLPSSKTVYRSQMLKLRGTVGKIITLYQTRPNFVTKFRLMKNYLQMFRNLNVSGVMKELYELVQDLYAHFQRYSALCEFILTL